MTPVFAYIDPSSGMITIQLLIASLAGGLIYCRHVIASIVRKLTKKSKNEAP